MKNQKPSINCWILIFDGEVATHQDDSGIGIINGVDYNQVHDMEYDIFCYMQDQLDEIPEAAMMAEFVASDFNHFDEQRSFAPPVHPDFPAGWEMEMELIGFHMKNGDNDPIFKNVIYRRKECSDLSNG